MTQLQMQNSQVAPSRIVYHKYDREPLRKKEKPAQGVCYLQNVKFMKRSKRNNVKALDHTGMHSYFSWNNS